MRYEYNISAGNLGGTENCTAASCYISLIFTSYFDVKQVTCAKTLNFAFLHTTRKRSHRAPQTYDTWARKWNIIWTEVQQASA
jgi:hypothetical protein